jgi:hypothetical protein
MVVTESPHLTEFEQALVGWTDQRFVTRDQVRDLSIFALYIVNLAEDDGWVYRGHSYKEGCPMGCLVVKADVDGVPSVVFTSGKSYASCVGIFLRKLREGWLEWSVDRYRA